MKDTSGGTSLPLSESMSACLCVCLSLCFYVYLCVCLFFLFQFFCLILCVCFFWLIVFRIFLTLTHRYLQEEWNIKRQSSQGRELFSKGRMKVISLLLFFILYCFFLFCCYDIIFQVFLFINTMNIIILLL